MSMDIDCTRENSLYCEHGICLLFQLCGNLKQKYCCRPRVTSQPKQNGDNCIKNKRKHFKQ